MMCIVVLPQLFCTKKVGPCKNNHKKKKDLIFDLESLNFTVQILVENVVEILVATLEDPHSVESS